MADAHAHDAARCLALCESTEIAAPIARVFARWRRYEDFPRFAPSVRRTRRIDDRNVLWDVDVLARQVVWFARIVEVVPPKLIRWDARSGARSRGEVRFEALDAHRTRVVVEIAYQPRTFVERLVARLGVLDRQVRRELEGFRRFVEGVPADDDEPALGVDPAPA